MKPEVSAYLEGRSEEVRRAGAALCDAIRHAGPGLAQRLFHGHPSWHGRAWVFSVIAHAGHCNLQLARGSDLAGEYAERIVGTGKSLRHVKVRTEDEIDCELEAIIAAAIALDAQGPAPAPRRKA